MSNLILYASVALATVFSTGVFVLLGAYLIARSISQYTQAVAANTGAIDRYVAFQRDRDLRQAQAGGQVFGFPGGPRGDDPKGSA